MDLQTATTPCVDDLREDRVLTQQPPLPPTDNTDLLLQILTTQRLQTQQLEAIEWNLRPVRAVAIIMLVVFGIGALLAIVGFIVAGSWVTILIDALQNYP